MRGEGRNVDHVLHIVVEAAQRAFECLEVRKLVPIRQLAVPER
jgi:hypothetical protein